MVEIYKGKYITADDAEKYIDVETIKKSCNLLKDGADKLGQTKERVINAKGYCGRDSFYIDDYTYEDKASDNANNLKNASLYIADFSDRILVALEKALEKKQLELNEIAMEEDMKLIEEKGLPE